MWVWRWEREAEELERVPAIEGRLDVVVLVVVVVIIVVIVVGIVYWRGHGRMPENAHHARAHNRAANLVLTGC